MKAALLASVIFFIVVSALYLLMPHLLALRGVIMKQTRFGKALIFETSDAAGHTLRLLNVKGVFQSARYTDKALQDELVCEYHINMAAIIEKLAETQNRALSVLIMGGGGFCLPTYLAQHGACSQITVVEIDPAIIDIAQEHFFADMSAFTVICADAWDYLCSSDLKFDVIVNDAFSGKRPLGKMSCEEGADEIARHLFFGGVYLANIRASLEGKNSRILKQVTDAFSKKFSRVRCVPEHPEDHKKIAYNTFIASDANLFLPKGTLRLN